LNWCDVHCGLSLLCPQTANHLLDPSRVPGRSGNAHPNIRPYDTFATSTVPIFLALGNDGQFAKVEPGFFVGRRVG